MNGWLKDKGRVFILAIASILLILAPSAQSFAFITALAGYIVYAVMWGLILKLASAGMAIMYAFVEPFYVMIGFLLTSEEMKPIVHTGQTLQLASGIMSVILPVMVLGLIISALRLLFTTLSPGERHMAKNQVIKMLAALILIPIGPYLIQLLVNITHVIVSDFLLGDEMLSSIGASRHGWGVMAATIAQNISIGYCFIQALLYILLILAIATLLVRYVLVIVFTALFPVTLFLYLFDYTKSVGRKFMKWTLAWVFAPIFMGIWALIALAMAESIQGGRVLWDVGAARVH